MKDTKFDQTDFLKLGFFISLIALVWNLPTLGNNLMPRNFMGWFGVIIISSLILGFGLAQRSVWISKEVLFLFIPPVAMLVHGLIFPPTETMSYYMWLAIGVSAGFGFYLLALFQIKDTDQVWLKISKIILVIFCIQAVLTEIIYQTSFGKFLMMHLPVQLRAVQAGFQQPNLMSSFGAALILWNFALLLKFNVTKQREWALLGFASFFIAFIVFQTGSRTAGLGLLAGMSLLVIFSLKEKKFNYALWVIVAVGFAFILQYLVASDFGSARRGSFAAAADLSM